MRRHQKNFEADGFGFSPRGAVLDIRYAKEELHYRYLVFQDDAQSIRIHVDTFAAHRTLDALLKRTEQIVEQFLDSAKRLKQTADKTEIVIWTDSTPIFYGRRVRLMHTLGRKFRENIFPDVFVGGFSALLYFSLYREMEEAMVVGITAAALLLIWTGLELIFKKDQYEYERHWS